MKSPRTGGYVCWALAFLLGWIFGQAGDRQMALAQSPAGNPSLAAPPDTLLANIVLPEDQSPPVNVSVVPDSVVFGGMAFALLEWPSGEAPPAPEGVSFSVDWLAAVESGEADRPLSTWLSAAPDQRLAVPFRVYQTAPFRLLAGSGFSEVVQALGRVTGTDSLAPIRQPRNWGGWWAPLMLAALVLTLVVLALWWSIQRRRRGGGDPWTDWEISSPAWVGAAVDLRALLAGDALARGDGRNFLDGLAAVTRGFVGAHYRVPALEMTGQEIVTACIRLGYGPGRPRQFAQIIDLADRYRYDREQPDTAICLDQARRLCDLMQTVRIMPRQTVVQPQRLLQAEQAWASIASELGFSSPRAPDPTPAGGG